MEPTCYISSCMCVTYTSGYMSSIDMVSKNIFTNHSALQDGPGSITTLNRSSHVVLHKPCFVFFDIIYSTYQRKMVKVKNKWLKPCANRFCLVSFSATRQMQSMHVFHLFALHVDTPVDTPEGKPWFWHPHWTQPCWPCCETACPSRTSSIGNLPQKATASSYKGSKGIEKWKKIQWGCSWGSKWI